MELISVRNPQNGIPELLYRIVETGVEVETRDGKAIQFPHPCTIIWGKPMERVVFWPLRDANPFFHLFESLWMLSGRNDLEFVQNYVKRMEIYSDDGKTLHGAYGNRWINHFNINQLESIIEALKKNPACRRQVLMMWDPDADLGRQGKDLPCNISATFQINPIGKLDMVVHNRSNDGIMGAMGANVVHFSILQEYVATGVGTPVGRYWQVSSNMHVYMRDFSKYQDLQDEIDDPYKTIKKDPYISKEVETTVVVDLPLKEWNRDLKLWMKDPYKVGIESKFFTRIATPMYAAHEAYKKGQLTGAIEILQTQMPEKSDWKKASIEWLKRRKV